MGVGRIHLGMTRYGSKDRMHAVRSSPGDVEILLVFGTDERPQQFRILEVAEHCAGAILELAQRGQSRLNGFSVSAPKSFIFYFFGMLAGGTIPFMRAYSTNCP